MNALFGSKNILCSYFPVHRWHTPLLTALPLWEFIFGCSVPPEVSSHRDLPPGMAHAACSSTRNFIVGHFTCDLRSHSLRVTWITPYSHKICYSIRSVKFTDFLSSDSVLDENHKNDKDAALPKNSWSHLQCYSFITAFPSLPFPPLVKNEQRHRLTLSSRQFWCCLVTKTEFIQSSVLPRAQRTQSNL